MFKKIFKPIKPIDVTQLPAYVEFKNMIEDIKNSLNRLEEVEDYKINQIDKLLWLLNNNDEGD